MFKSMLPGKNSGNWNFMVAAEAAALETKMLRNNLTIAEVARQNNVSAATVKEFLQNGTHNKAYAILKKRNWL